jgi:RNA methyltransferase, TrmH family
MEMISSRQNGLVKHLKKLVASKQSRFEHRQIVAEGAHLLQILLASGQQPDMVVVAERAGNDPEVLALLACCEHARVVTISNTIFDQLALTDSPSGLISVAARPMPSCQPDQKIDTLVLDRVQDPGNVGSLIRTAVAAGIRQIVLSSGCADAWSPRCLRAGQGAQWLSTVYADIDLAVFLETYAGAIAATILDGGVSLYTQDLRQPTAWLFGNEGQGLEPQWSAMATHRVTIPMPGGMESMNVNAAAAVCFFEQVRQRTVVLPGQVSVC